jgi:hypothetical protein
MILGLCHFVIAKISLSRLFPGWIFLWCRKLYTIFFRCIPKNKGASKSGTIIFLFLPLSQNSKEPNYILQNLPGIFI